MKVDYNPYEGREVTGAIDTVVSRGRVDRRRRDVHRPRRRRILPEAKRPMTGDEIIALTKKHTIFEWAVQGAVDPDSGGAREGRVLLDARRQALHRLQQPADVRQHRPRRSAGRQGDSGSGRGPDLRDAGDGDRAARAARREARRAHAGRSSTSSSSPTAAPRPTRTPSRSRARTPAGRRSWPATARITAAPRRRSPPPASREAGARRRCRASSTCSTRITGSSAGGNRPTSRCAISRK